MQENEISKVYRITDSIKADYIFNLFLKDKSLDQIVDIYKKKIFGMEEYDYPTPWIFDFYLGKDDNDLFEQSMSLWAKDNGFLKHPLLMDIDKISCDEAVLLGDVCFILPDNEELHEHLFSKEYELLNTLFKDGKELGISVADREIILSNVKEIPQYGYLYTEIHSLLERDKIKASTGYEESNEPSVRKRRI